MTNRQTVLKQYRTLPHVALHAGSRQEFLDLLTINSLTVGLYSNFNNISYMATTTKSTRLQAKQLSEMSPNGK